MEPFIECQWPEVLEGPLLTMVIEVGEKVVEVVDREGVVQWSFAEVKLAATNDGLIGPQMPLTSKIELASICVAPRRAVRLLELVHLSSWI
jgi:hypothetical protein